MSNWRDYILQQFQTPSYRLTLVADPDGLMLEEQLLATIRTNGFQLLRFDDAVQFRYAYESQFRGKWDRGEETELVVVLRSSNHDLGQLPFDLLKSGRQLNFRLSDLFPNLSYPVVAELDRSDLDALYAAYQDYRSETLGDLGTRAYLLEHVFDVPLQSIQSLTQVLKHLLSRHYRGRRVPASLDRLLVERLRQIPGIETWNLEKIVSDRESFFSFLQKAWPRFLIEYHVKTTGVRESRIDYALDAPLLPLDERDIQAYIDSLFLEGHLQPIQVPDDWRRDSWTEVGVIRDVEINRQLRSQALIEQVRKQVPNDSSTHQDWLRFARAWAELIVLRHSLPTSSPLPNAIQFDTLQLEAETCFAEWMQNRYLALHNYPPLPVPVMLHQIPHYLAHQHKQGTFKRIALLVLDGLSFGQWLVIQEQLRANGDAWSFAEQSVFAWVPTLTPISRQSIFAALAPLHFPTTWSRTDRDEQRWFRFWQDEGLSSNAIGYFNGPNLDDDPALDDWLEDSRSLVAGLVVRQVDEIMHGMQLGTAGMHQQVKLWVERGHLARLITKLDHAGFAVFITADHGNITAKGIGKPQQGDLLDQRGQRALQFQDLVFLKRAQEQYPTAIPWRSDALPESVHVLLADGLNAFEIANQEIVCHGGISLEEVIVPFIQVKSIGG
jgi:hypothetical protein